MDLSVPHRFGAWLGLVAIATSLAVALAFTSPAASFDLLEDKARSEFLDGVAGNAAAVAQREGSRGDELTPQRGFNPTVSLPTDGRPKVTIGSAWAPNVKTSIGLPEGVSGARARVRNLGALSASTLAEGGSYAVTSEVLEDGAHVLVSILNSGAPTSYRFTIDTTIASELVEVDSGGIEIRDKAGESISYLMPPWAVDADGNEVPTRFEVDGNVVVQHVAHGGAIYPVVADPRVQQDCGIVTCTIRFNRPTTRYIKDHGHMTATAVAGVVCANLRETVLVAVCTTVWSIVAYIASVNAANYYNNGNCYAIRHARPVWNTPGRPYPVIAYAHSHQVNIGDYNCHPESTK